jgi:hypothetical protein
MKRVQCAAKDGGVIVGGFSYTGAEERKIHRLGLRLLEISVVAVCDNALMQQA